MREIISFRNKLYILYFIPIISLIILFYFIPAIPQWQSFYDYADKTSFLGITNFWNVITNLPFLIVGILGISFLYKYHNEKKIKRGKYILKSSKNIQIETVIEWKIILTFFIIVCLIALASAYYHLNPNNNTLLWGRLPIIAAFMVLTSWVMAERIDVKTGYLLNLPLISFGIFSVVYWYLTEINNMGGLRLYGFAQFFPMFLILIIFLLFNPKYTRTGDYFIALGLYLIAHIFEIFDKIIFNLISFGGGAIKHIFSAIAIYWLLRMIQKRQLVR